MTKESFVNSSREYCLWNGTVCRDRQCEDSPPTSDYDDHTECASYKHDCTVGLTLVCKTREMYCNNYVYEVSCVVTTFNGKCIWDENTCLTGTGNTDCSAIVMQTYTYAKCNRM